MKQELGWALHKEPMKGSPMIFRKELAGEEVRYV
jgi:hypothetical protein